MKPNIPFSFILDYLHPLEVAIKPMFGCFNLYVRDEIIFFLRERNDRQELNGVWVAVSSPESYDSLKEELPSINQDKKIIENKQSNKKWLLLSVHDSEFEALVRKACELVLNKDKRIGKVTKGSIKNK